MKRTLSITAFIMCIILALPNTAYAKTMESSGKNYPGIEYNLDSTVDADKTMIMLNQLRPEWSLNQPQVDEEFVVLWTELCNLSGVYLDDDGYIHIDYAVANDYVNERAFGILENVIGGWNYAMSIQLLAIDPVSMDFYTPEITDEIIMNISERSHSTIYEQLLQIL